MNKQYRVSINGELVDVSEELYLEYYRSERRMRYFERDVKTERAIRGKDGKVTGYAPSKEDSLDRLIELGEDFRDESLSPECQVIAQMTSEALRKAMDKLESEERALIDVLFFSNGGDGMTERECAKLFNLSKTAIHARKDKVLAKLKNNF